MIYQARREASSPRKRDAQHQSATRSVVAALPRRDAQHQSAMRSIVAALPRRDAQHRRPRDAPHITQAMRSIVAHTARHLAAKSPHLTIQHHPHQSVNAVRQSHA
ncbi:hypothetical protein [Mesorhizobium sp. B2-7-2]|uniref:hypothetical protein n=1 Tax=Mesorhizobium sp. B2-7-2 TaxID=2589908 RepID=UPI001127C4A0|nr:hypothetical protein [Mesorhizobium sp. B2-7-2]TPJ27673.1 hypothetical protein FJ425_14850 [Mesorhizobium sp. B2-7-2]